MSVTNEVRRPSGKFQSAPFRTRGERATACVHCPEYRRTGTAGEPLARVGLRGVCVRAGGFCQEVRH